MVPKAVHMSDISSLVQLHELPTGFSSAGVDVGRVGFKIPKFLVIGHRGNGMNIPQSSNRRMKGIKENSILSFNTAAKFALDFIEFDVQVTKDDCPIIFHDNLILFEENGTIFENRVTELSLSEFLSYGPQKEPGIVGKSLLRKTKDNKILNWNVETDDSFCTLQEAFEKGSPSMGFNIELKFDDQVVYHHDHLFHVLQSILQVVSLHAKDRPIIFSTFQPDAALLIRKLQCNYPVFFLTNGGNEIYPDTRRNSVEEAVKLCLEGGLQGIVSEVRGILRNPAAINMIKESNLSLLTYGKLNNVPEVVYLQHLIGVEGVITDFVQEITEAVSTMTKPSREGRVREIVLEGGEEDVQVQFVKPQFSEIELAFLLKLVSQLVHQ